MKNKTSRKKTNKNYKDSIPHHNTDVTPQIPLETNKDVHDKHSLNWTGDEDRCEITNVYSDKNGVTRSEVIKVVYKTPKINYGEWWMYRATGEHYKVTYIDKTKLHVDDEGSPYVSVRRISDGSYSKHELDDFLRDFTK
jgi:hypothetical protein